MLCYVRASLWLKILPLHSPVVSVSHSRHLSREMSISDIYSSSSWLLIVIDMFCTLQGVGSRAGPDDSGFNSSVWHAWSSIGDRLTWRSAHMSQSTSHVLDMYSCARFV